MIRGPKPEAAEIKAAKGNPGHRAIPDATAAPASALTEQLVPPDWLDGPGLEMWRALLPEFLLARYIKQSDVPALARYCTNFARWIALRAQVAEQGEVIITSSAHVKDMPRVNPAAKLMHVIEAELVATESNFGRNPAARMQLAARLAIGGASPTPQLPGPGFQTPGEAAPAHAAGPLGLLARASSQPPERPN